MAVFDFELKDLDSPLRIMNPELQNIGKPVMFPECRFLCTVQQFLQFPSLGRHRVKILFNVDGDLTDGIGGLDDGSEDGHEKGAGLR